MNAREVVIAQYAWEARETQQVVIVQGASRRKPLNGGDESAG